MPFKLVSEEDMASRSKKEKEIKKDIKISVVKSIEDDKTIKIEKDTKIETDDKAKDKDNIIKIQPDGNVIIKKVYFPTDLYSKNQAEFKKILANYGLAWFKPMYKMYVSKKGVKIATGSYISNDKNKWVLCIYEGSKMPMTAMIKITGTGGNFLVDMNSFCTKAGCLIEDKDELFFDNVKSTLKERGEIYVEGMEETIAEKLKKGDISLDKKIEEMIEESLQKYENAYKDSLQRKNVSLETFKFFKRKDIEKDIKWAIENGLIEI